MVTQILQSPSAALPRIGPHTALFLDFDGTLVDLAPQPEAVRIEGDLISILAELAAYLSGALAIVSGRRLMDLDHFLTPLKLPSAAEHGAQCRLSQGQVVRMASPDLRNVTQRARALAERHSGLHLEIKSAAVALHYRHAPELESQALQVMLDAAASTPGMELLRGKFVFEVKPAQISKGTAIGAFMADAPFAGRTPLFAGDDATDEAGFSAVQLLGGQGIKVGAGLTLAHHRCATPAALRQWLKTAAQRPHRISKNNP
ncbi:MAG: trehalose-phosphatase [Polaromonas sp.]|uniref:trehalose-phosphatase n=1 Tax=Polaromonas sp. TaxID=1869339 RepID=UPI0018163932|nr:trehalose-phosphatase [Polaromonas sp.]NMM11465.1 trehalose-phosphatase [Polaromonas sp.]